MKDKAEKFAEDRRVANENKQRLVTLNITVSGVTRSLHVVPAVTVAMLRDGVARAFDIRTRKDAKGIRIMCDNENVFEHLGEHCRSLVCQMPSIPKGAGGAKQAGGAKEDLDTLLDFNVTTPESKEIQAE